MWLLWLIPVAFVILMALGCVVGLYLGRFGDAFIDGQE